MELPTTAPPTNPIIWVPAASVMRRGEMNAVYVKSAQGMFLLRQVRIGQTQGDKVQILTGLSADEEIAIDPQAAASAEPAQ
jgi:multidrug efflux pump subunit AcrA (membrane-fusion protein)